jgi:predicted hydrocarbon binding protein
MSDRTAPAEFLSIPVSALGALHRAIARDHAPADAATLVREIGLESGEGFYAALREWLAESGAPGEELEALPADEFWGTLSRFFASLGWGDLEQERLHPAVLALSSRNWIEARGNADAKQPSCHLTTGLLADLLRRVAETELAAMEVECRARGHDRCLFLLGNPEALERVFERMRGGDAFASAVEAL